MHAMQQYPIPFLPHSMCSFFGRFMRHRDRLSTLLDPVLLTFLRHVARIPANGIAAFKESCAPIG